LPLWQHLHWIGTPSRYRKFIAILSTPPCHWISTPLRHRAFIDSLAASPSARLRNFGHRGSITRDQGFHRQFVSIWKFDTGHSLPCCQKNFHGIGLIRRCDREHSLPVSQHLHSYAFAISVTGNSLLGHSLSRTRGGSQCRFDSISIQGIHCQFGGISSGTLSRFQIERIH
jgi:hypothetical protein